MDVVELINKRVDFYTLINKYNVKGAKEFGDVIRCACPIHGGSNPTSFVYHLDKKVYCCHSCGCTGDAIQFVEDMEKCTFKEAIKILTDMLEIDITNIKIIEKKNRYAKEVEQLKKMYKRKVKKIEAFDISKYDLKQIKEYRGFDEDTLKEFNICYAEEIEEWHKRIVVPIVSNGVIVGLSTRRTIQDNSPKWIHIPRGIKTGDLLFNFDNCIEATEIIVCEGIWDALKWHMAGFKAVCTYGAKLSDEQMKLLIKTGADIIFNYDNDEAGEKATTKAYEKLKGKATMYLISFEGNNDAGELSVIDLIKAYNNKKRMI